MDIAKQIKAARRRLKLSQSEAANAWQIPLPTIRAWEQGVNTPSGANLLKLMQLGVVTPTPPAAKPKRRS